MSDELLDDDTMRAEYDFSASKPSPVAKYFQQAGVRVLDEDVRAVFPDSESVNEALRGLVELAKRSGGTGTKAA